ncbi:hypothetical protein LIPSTDRAFT_66768 [Lipomyces starkeyi NRRL Y-11557]|uniref:Uncharacterized protein n=1 Tax=Lipomyces starkeyi NRRL Y-11557 TaxID=675824 RepID=A0A1E3PUK4_LIPST|nr:hypothetical protein LIPSTDRAFT_66768 [Lipomyces starkeyi NRRL Y-11557]
MDPTYELNIQIHRDYGEGTAVLMQATEALRISKTRTSCNSQNVSNTAASKVSFSTTDEVRPILRLLRREGVLIFHSSNTAHRARKHFAAAIPSLVKTVAIKNTMKENYFDPAENVLVVVCSWKRDSWYNETGITVAYRRYYYPHYNNPVTDVHGLTDLQAMVLSLPSKDLGAHLGQMSNGP